MHPYLRNYASFRRSTIREHQSPYRVADIRLPFSSKRNIAVSELADNSINLIVRPWVNSCDLWNVKYSILEQIKKRFDEEGISIPYPQRDVHIYNHDIKK